MAQLSGNLEKLGRIADGYDLPPVSKARDLTREQLLGPPFVVLDVGHLAEVRAERRMGSPRLELIPN